MPPHFKNDRCIEKSFSYHKMYPLKVCSYTAPSPIHIKSSLGWLPEQAVCILSLVVVCFFLSTCRSSLNTLVHSPLSFLCVAKLLLVFSPSLYGVFDFEFINYCPCDLCLLVSHLWNFSLPQGHLNSLFFLISCSCCILRLPGIDLYMIGFRSSISCLSIRIFQCSSPIYWNVSSYLTDFLGQPCHKSDVSFWTLYFVLLVSFS